MGQSVSLLQVVRSDSSIEAKKQLLQEVLQQSKNDPTLLNAADEEGKVWTRISMNLCVKSLLIASIIHTYQLVCFPQRIIDRLHYIGRQLKGKMNL